MLSLQASELKKFVIVCLPSFIILVLSIAFTLIKSPSISRPASPIIEEQDIDMRLKASGVERKHLDTIQKRLQKTFNRKMFFKRYIGATAIINFIVSIAFIIIRTFNPDTLTQNFDIFLCVISLIAIPILSWALSYNTTLTASIKLDNSENLSEYLLD